MNTPQGIIATLEELILLKRFVNPKAFSLQGKQIQGGNHLSKWRGRGMDFAETRHYQAGDEIRHMEWKVTARTGRPHIKIFEEEKERPVFIVVDFNPSMYFGTRTAFKSVIAAKMAALIAWTVVKQGDRLGGFLYSSDSYHAFMPKTRQGSLLPILEKLSEYTARYSQQEKGRPCLLSEALDRLRRINRPGSIIVLLSDFYHFDEAAERHFSLLREHSEILAYNIADPLELSPPIPGLYPLISEKESLFLDTRSRAISASYQNWCENRRVFLQDKCKRLQLGLTQVTAEDFLPGLVHKTFPRRKRD